jgi:hypothetical protein
VLKKLTISSKSISYTRALSWDIRMHSQVSLVTHAQICGRLAHTKAHAYWPVAVIVTMIDRGTQ